MCAAMQMSLSSLRASVTEGRSENVRYRQDQLQALHTGFRENVDATTEAIAIDSGCTAEEADVEFYLGMDALRKAYESLNFESSLQQEYQVAHGKDNVERRVAMGLVAIRPSQHSRFYSTLAPLVAALAAGNCILLELGTSLETSSPSVDALLAKVLKSALDQDTFQISASHLDDASLAETDLFVDQLASSKRFSCETLVSSPTSRSIAIVDRASNIQLAAKEITTARLFSNGTSPYSPDLVIVNEYIGEAFGKACLQHANSLGLSAKTRPISIEEKKLQTSLQSEEKNGKIKVHKYGSTDLTIVEILDRNSPLAHMKIQGPYIMMLPSTGLVDSVNWQRLSPPLSACYLFASPAACKFLSEQVSSRATFVNHIPPSLLIGPASPLKYTHNLHPRYLPDMFSLPRPQFVVPSAVLPTSTKLKELALAKLPPTNQRPGHALGFFEQGILIGLGTSALLILPMLGWGIFAGGKHGWKLITARLRW